MDYDTWRRRRLARRFSCCLCFCFVVATLICGVCFFSIYSPEVPSATVEIGGNLMSRYYWTRLGLTRSGSTKSKLHSQTSRSLSSTSLYLVAFVENYLPTAQHFLPGNSLSMLAMNLDFRSITMVGTHLYIVLVVKTASSASIHWQKPKGLFHVVFTWLGFQISHLMVIFSTRFLTTLLSRTHSAFLLDHQAHHLPHQLQFILMNQASIGRPWLWIQVY